MGLSQESLIRSVDAAQGAIASKFFTGNFAMLCQVECSCPTRCAVISRKTTDVIRVFIPWSSANTERISRRSAGNPR